MSVPEFQEAYQQIERGEAAEAIPALERLVKEMPGYTAAQVLLARAYEADGQTGRALAYWQRTLFLMPNSPKANEAVARLSERQRQERAERAASTTEAVSSAGESAESNHSEEEEVSLFPPIPRGKVPTQKPPLQSDLEELAEAEAYDDLDRLIEELESARIEPDPDMDELPPPDLEDEIDDVVSETLARIFTAQEQYWDAARIYTQLATQEPEREEEFRAKAAEMRRRAEGQAE